MNFIIKILIIKILKNNTILLFIKIIIILKYMKNDRDNNIRRSVYEGQNDLFHYFYNTIKTLSSDRITIHHRMDISLSQCIQNIQNQRQSIIETGISFVVCRLVHTFSVAQLPIVRKKSIQPLPLVTSGEIFLVHIEISVLFSFVF